MQAFFGGHCWGEHVQADGAGQLRLQGLGRDRYLCCICYRLLWRPDAKVLILRIKLDDSHFTGSGKYNWLLGCLTWKYTCAARRGRGPMTFLRVQSSWITALFSEIYVTDICIKSCKMQTINVWLISDSIWMKGDNFRAIFIQRPVVLNQAKPNQIDNIWNLPYFQVQQRPKNAKDQLGAPIPMVFWFSYTLANNQLQS